MKLASWLLRPRLSVVMVVYRMAEQAERTLHSLCSRYQHQVHERDYEVIVVENRSDAMLGATRACTHGGNVRYFSRDESLPTPVNAVNFGVSQARGRNVAVMIDGARMLTPGVLRLTLDALDMDPSGTVALPGYHLGHRPQQEAFDAGEYDLAEEAALLAGIGWPEDGYRLFDIAALSLSSQDGFLLPAPESNFLAMSMQAWRSIGGMDPRYDSHGGGYANIDLYKRALERAGTRCYLLFGEGSFHQFHGGVTTGTPRSEREQTYRAIIAQDERIRPNDRSHPQNVPVMLGTLHPAAYRFLAYSLERAGAIYQTRQPQREK